jgi:diacylglycerol O-acyltransferase
MMWCWRWLRVVRGSSCYLMVNCLTSRCWPRCLCRQTAWVPSGNRVMPPRSCSPRYEAIRAATEMGKLELELVGRETFALLAHYTPPALQRWAASRGYRKRLADNKKFRPPANLTVSNVPGPREKFSTRGNLVDSIYSSGPLVEGIGLNITVWSYAGKMNFTATGCMRALPDIHKITTGLQDALLELQDAA